MDEDRLFNFLTPGRFRGGWIGTHTQVLIYFGHHENLILWFDGQGEFLRIESVPFRYGDSEEYSDFMKRYDAWVDAWKQEHGVVSGMLRVRQFSIAEPFRIAIARYPKHYLEFIEDPYEEAPKRWAKYWQGIADWDSEESFVFYWNMSDYFMDKSGRVTST